ncbi:MAG: prepilin-type N-terminal cleavage/methylation domain-containing protein [Clostridiales bacterium]|jgi:prepilin-type N-terminal cleavage/methylation domain-containing protein|nr:prepilin-type N-terminal cleavage/methylation domain-containing protein [Clostridiales bacterium]
MRSRKTSNKGFTLIELIVVMVIIGILALLATPRIMDITKNARESACEGNVRTLLSVTSIYEAQYAGKEKEGGGTWSLLTSDASSLESLVEAGLLVKVPECPVDAGSEYTYNPSDGDVTCSHAVDNVSDVVDDTTPSQSTPPIG